VTTGGAVGAGGAGDTRARPAAAPNPVGEPTVRIAPAAEATERFTPIAVVTEPPALRLSFVDGVRAFAAVFVVAHHIWLTTYPGYPRDTGPAWASWLVYGHLAVAVFIVVSGFSLAIAPARRDYRLGGVGRFLRRRAWRILPPYWAALALSAAVFGLVTPALTGDLVSVKGIVVHALLLQDVIDAPRPNGAFWSIAIEWQIYFLFPLVLLVRRRLPGWALAALGLAVVVAAQVVSERVPALDGIRNLTPQFFALFVFGVVAAEVVRSGLRARALVGAAALLCFAGFAVLAFTAGPVWVDAHYFWVDLAVGAGTALALAVLAGGGWRPVAAAFAGRVPRFLGHFSYSVYLIHLPLLWLVYHFGVEPAVDSADARFVLLLVVGIPVVLAVSHLFHRAFERPFIEHRSLAELRGRSTQST